MDVFQGWLQASVPQDFLQSEIRPAFHYESSSKSVPKYVRRALYALKASFNSNSPYELLNTVN